MATGVWLSFQPIHRDGALALIEWLGVFPQVAWRNISVFGLGWCAVLIISLVDRGDQGGRKALVLLLIGGLLIQALKSLIDHPRPGLVLDLDPSLGLSPVRDRLSMPSGHAFAALTCATVLWLAADDRAARWRMGLIGFLAAVLVCLSRIALADHWPADVLVGAGLGLWAGLAAHALAPRLTGSGGVQLPWAALLIECAAAFSAVTMGLRDPATSLLGFALGGAALLSVGVRLWQLSPWQSSGIKAGQPVDGAGPVTTLIALLVLYGLMLGAAPLFDVDEGAFAESSRYMLISGDWLHTTLLGVDRFDKPILVYWLQASSLALLGPSEFAARLPSAMAVVMACMAVGRAMTARFGPVVAWRAAFILGTCPGLLLIGRASTADGLLNALLIATALSLLAFVQTGRTRSLTWAYLWCGLGLLTKGPVAILVPGAALVLWSLASDRGRTALRAMIHLRGWLLLLAVTSPWYVYAFLRHGEAFINGFLVRHNLERFLGPLEGHGGSVGYYLLLLPILVLPWFPLLVQALSRIRTYWSEPTSRFLLLWAGFVFGFFSLSGTKLPHYLLYGIPPLAILMAIESTRVGRWGRWMMALSIAVFLLVVPVLPLLADRWGSKIPDEWIRQLLASAPAPSDLLIGSGGLVALFLVTALLRRRWGWREQQVSVASVALLWVTLLVPWVGQTLQEPFRVMASWARAEGWRVVQWQMYQPSVAFYRQGPAPRRGPEPGEVALVRASRTDLSGPEFEVLREYRGLRWIRRRLD